MVAPGWRSSIVCASSAVIRSPGTNSPVSSMKKQRSASPSHAMPRSAPSLRTRSMMKRRFSSSSGLGSWLGKCPSGSKLWADVRTGRRSSTGPIMGPAMPLQPSSTIESGRTAEASMNADTRSWNAA